MLHQWNVIACMATIGKLLKKCENLGNLTLNPRFSIKMIMLYNNP